MISSDIPNAISSRASEDGAARFALHDGQPLSRCGPEVVLANPSRARITAITTENAWALMIRAIYGRRSVASSTGSILQQSLGSKLQARMGGNGSPEYCLTWRSWDIRGGRRICALRASARPTSDNAFTGWLTPTATEQNHGTIKFHFDRAKAAKYEARFRLGDQAILELGLPLVKSGLVAESDTELRLNPNHSRWLMGYPIAWDSTGDTAMQSFRKSPRNSSKRPKKPALIAEVEWPEEPMGMESVEFL